MGIEEDESDFGGCRADNDATTDQERDAQFSSMDELDRKKKFRKKLKKKVTIKDKQDGDISDEDRSSPGLQRRPQPAANRFSNLWKRSRRSASSAPTSEDEDDRGCFPRRQPGKYYTTTMEEYKIETTIHVDNLKGNIVFSQPPEGTSQGAAGEGTTTNVTNNVKYVINLQNFDTALLDVLKNLPPDKTVSDEILGQFFSAMPQVRASMRKKTTKSKNLDQTDIERDSAGVSNMGIGDLENEEPCLDNEDLLYQNGTEFKNMINSLKDNSDETRVQAVITESPTGEISITWKVLVKKITEHQEVGLAWAIPKVIVIIVVSAIGIIALIVLLHYLDAFKTL